MHKGFTIVELLVVFAILGILIALVMGSCSCVSYGTSDGYRDGFIQKVCKKNGYTTSSWEMEVALPGGSMIQGKFGQNGGNVWECSLPDNGAVLKQAQEVDVTQLVRIYYHEYRYNWPHWTNYTATKIEILHPKAEK